MKCNTLHVVEISIVLVGIAMSVSLPLVITMSCTLFFLVPVTSYTLVLSLSRDLLSVMIIFVKKKKRKQ